MSNHGASRCSESRNERFISVFLKGGKIMTFFGYVQNVDGYESKHYG